MKLQDFTPDFRLLLRKYSVTPEFYDSIEQTLRTLFAYCSTHERQAVTEALKELTYVKYGDVLKKYIGTRAEDLMLEAVDKPVFTALVELPDDTLYRIADNRRAYRQGSGGSYIQWGNLEHFIDSAFQWAETEEGDDFWPQLHRNRQMTYATWKEKYG